MGAMNKFADQRRTILVPGDYAGPDRDFVGYGRHAPIVEGYAK